VVTFTGHVRGDAGLTALTLEHYPGMTEREIASHVRRGRAALAADRA
jgi:molybdopterin synthase catalytic subunit